jgi:hypothetical protein
MCQFDNCLDVTILPPYVPSEEEKASPALYAKHVQQLYAKTLELPIVDQVTLCCANVQVVSCQACSYKHLL